MDPAAEVAAAAAPPATITMAACEVLVLLVEYVWPAASACCVMFATVCAFVAKPAVGVVSELKQKGTLPLASSL